MSVYRSALIATTLLTAANVAIAQTERDLDSHEHGAGALNIALDGNAVFIELESPWNNIVGFEHEPNTPEQEKLVDDALALLNDPAKLFAFTGTDCTVTQTSLENGLEHDEHHDEHDDEHKDEHHDDEHKDDHHDDEHKDEHHDDEHNDEHHDDHAAEHGDEETHSEVLLNAEFSCSDVSKLSAIEVSFLSIWSGFEDLDVQLIGPGGQAAIELNQNQTTVDTNQVN